MKKLGTTGLEILKISHLLFAVKWILTILLVIIGAGYMGMTIKDNVVYAQKMLSENISTDVYWDNVCDYRRNNPNRSICLYCGYIGHQALEKEEYESISQRVRL